MRCFSRVVGLFVLGAILAACVPASDQASTATPGQSLAIIAPTATLAPVATEVVATVEPEQATPEPTAAPESTATLVPTPLPAAIIMTGSGANITADFQVDAPFIIVEYSHSGTGYFGVQLKNAESAEMVDMPANAIGTVTGSNLSAIPPGAYFYEVAADGAWTITTKLAGHWARQPQETSYSFAGRASNASPIFPLSDGRANVALTHNGQGYFGVRLYDVASGRLLDMLANAIGPVNESASIAASAGDYIMQITADGDWTVQVSQ